MLSAAGLHRAAVSDKLPYVFSVRCLDVMNEPPSSDEVLIFAPEPDENGEPPNSAGRWRLLIVDDEPSVHEVTRLALTDLEFDGRPFEFLHAYTARDAREVLKTGPDIALAIVDVVMESEHSGLDLIRWIRNELGNSFIRLILRTGQPGHAPEQSVIRDYEINDYRDKSNLTAQRLRTSVLTSLRSYRDLMALEAGRRRMEDIIRAIGHVHDAPGLTKFVHAALEQLIAVLRPGSDAMFVIRDGEGAAEDSTVVVAATGCFAPLVDTRASERQWAPEVAAAIGGAMARQMSSLSDHGYTWYVRAGKGREIALYLAGPEVSAEEQKLVRVFLDNVSIAYDNALPVTVR